MKLWVKILIALALGTLIGGVMNYFGHTATYLKPIGDLFISLINMIIPLLVLSSMTVGITSIHDPQKLGRVGLKTLFVYLTTTAFAIVIGILAAKLFQPGSGLPLDLLPKVKGEIAGTEISIVRLLMDIVPKNPIAALVEPNVLQIIVFSVFLGIAINFAGERGKPLFRLLESLADVMYRLTSIVMEFSPYGIFALMTWVVSSFGTEVLKNLGKFLFAYYVACAFHLLFVFCGILYFIAKLNPRPFFRGMGDAIMVAFSTASSSASLPVTMHCVQKNLGVSKSITSFVLPLGSTVNMNGAAIYQGMAAIFFAQAYGIHLGFEKLFLVVITGTLSAIGAAGIPGSGYLMLTIVLSTVGLPLEGAIILWGIDRLREMASTVMNVLGDAIAAVYIAKVEGEFNERQYYHEELVEVEL